MIFTTKYRPKTFEEIIGQRKGIEMLKRFLNEFPKIKSVIVYGPSGTGKTALLYPLKRIYEVIQIDTSRIEKTNMLQGTEGAEV